jgi:hypothetical protein
MARTLHKYEHSNQPGGLAARSAKTGAVLKGLLGTRGPMYGPTRWLFLFYFLKNTTLLFTYLLYKI